ncbi:Ldh family oxidoreductase [Georgenia yuyongxinii]|uniref:Ldh family oxidoreductase n=1 Tax=Georgenia yuyongxinii TaxID=2589797 RepID=A0A552WU20_9MICO|nr:Ldh family oxidoreductase [Georgenia yuyongxinii]TRW45823.1 Ldh family oxidoreductase [Georgenia yuyongxinii]
MRHLAPAALHRITTRIFEAVGTPEDIASDVADVLVDNHLAGHDSHGVLRIAQYLQWIREGRIVPHARPEVLVDTSSTALVRGHMGFGQSVALVATDLATAKAKRNGVAAVSVVDLGHTGRLGAFTERAARQGVVMFMTVGSGGPAMTVPFGGAEPSLGTNPIAFSLPRGSQDPVTLDYATSAIANGKLMLARAKGEPVPEGSIVDREGAPTTDPEDYFAGGHLLPFGGHKGYALAVIADLLAGPLAGADSYSGAVMETGVFMFAVASDAFRPERDYLRAMDAVTARITGVPPAPGFDDVLLPGEPEARTHRARLNDGIPLPEETLAELTQIAADLGLDIDALDVPLPSGGGTPTRRQ